MDPLPPSSSRKLAAALAVLASVVVGVVLALPSCGLPDKTCFGDRVNALNGADDAGPDKECTGCLQRECCDRVGECSEDQACVTSFKNAQACVIDGGPSEEGRCKASLTTAASKNLYSCTRDKCADKCRVPSCTLDPAVILFANPSCDRCVGGACCEAINACYKSRGCKLVIECISKHCPRTVGPSMQLLGDAPPGTIAQVSADVCSGTGRSEVQPSPCLRRCLDDFAPAGDAGTPDDQSARCLAFGVYTCGAEARCGSRCLPPDSGPYSGDGEWAEDSEVGPSDASTD